MSETRQRPYPEEGCISRRRLLKAGGCLGAVAILTGGLPKKAVASEGVYPQVRIANLRDLTPGKVIKFDYPLIGRKSLLMDLGCRVEGGVGPDRSIVAFSMFCTHLGCSVELDRDKGLLVCECHQSEFDPRRSGFVIQGPAPTHLPMISLEVDSSTGDIYAIGVSGLIYGMRNNLLDGEEVK
jgi:arsenite oxidase small subunit